MFGTSLVQQFDCHGHRLAKGHIAILVEGIYAGRSLPRSAFAQAYSALLFFHHPRLRPSLIAKSKSSLTTDGSLTTGMCYYYEVFFEGCYDKRHIQQLGPVHFPQTLLILCMLHHDPLTEYSSHAKQAAHLTATANSWHPVFQQRGPCWSPSTAIVLGLAAAEVKNVVTAIEVTCQSTTSDNSNGEFRNTINGTGRDMETGRGHLPFKTLDDNT